MTMIVTEDEAKLKWCPEVRSSFINGGNRADTFNPLDAPCVGTQCMLWQTTNLTYLPDGGGDRVLEHHPSIPLPMGATDVVVNGHCGLVHGG
ncbi:MAG: hypothetical protein V3T23_04755 [Nitrososphaerales archaeon]